MKLLLTVVCTALEGMVDCCMTVTHIDRASHSLVGQSGRPEASEASITPTCPHFRLYVGCKTSAALQGNLRALKRTADE
eukprot:34136-Eustigmatos_ZCMA.PRE.1